MHKTQTDKKDRNKQMNKKYQQQQKYESKKKKKSDHGNPEKYWQYPTQALFPQNLETSSRLLLASKTFLAF